MGVWSFLAASVARRGAAAGSVRHPKARPSAGRAVTSPAVGGGGWPAAPRRAGGRGAPAGARSPALTSLLGRLLILGRPPRRPAADRIRPSIPVHGRFS